MTQDKPKPSSGAEGPERIFFEIDSCASEGIGEWYTDCIPGEEYFHTEYVKCSLERLRRLERVAELSLHRKYLDAFAEVELETLLSELRDKT